MDLWRLASPQCVAFLATLPRLVSMAFDDQALNALVFLYRAVLAVDLGEIATSNAERGPSSIPK